MNDLISVIIPFYNTGEYLRKCINSVLSQSYKNIEIILVNDGSDETSILICNNFIHSFNNIKMINKEKNEGAASARNAGLYASTGKYVAFVDSDDYIDENYIENLYNNLIKYNVDIACCGKSFIKKDILLDKDMLRYYYLKYNKYFSESPVYKLYKKEMFKDLKFKDNHYYEDTYINYKLIEKINKSVFFSDNSYHRVKRARSLTQSGIDDRYYDCILANKEIYDYYKNTKYEKLALKKYVGVLLYFLLKTSNNTNKYLDAKKEVERIIKENGVFVLKFKQILAYVYMIVVGKM